MTIMQLVATPIGAAAGVVDVSAAARHLRHRRRERRAVARRSRGKWAGFAEILSQGVDALPAGAVPALFIASMLGMVFAVLEERKMRWVPSPTGMGIAMLVPASVIFVMFLGGVVEMIWRRVNRAANEAYSVPLASGLIAGEAIVAVIMPLLVALGVISQ